MNETGKSRGPIRFGAFEVDLAGRVLRKSGVRVRLQEKPFRLLAVLLERPGEVVTRVELQKKLWPNEEFGELDLGLNTAVKKVRAALGDSATSPKWIETVPKVGYRFLAESQSSDTQARDRDHNTQQSGFPRATVVGLGLGCVAAAAYAFWSISSATPELDPSRLTETILTTYQGREEQPSFSPDGSQIAYSRWLESESSSDIYVEVVGSGVPRRITHSPEADRTPAWSPDGRSIAFVRSEPVRSAATVVIVPALGGPEERVLELGISEFWWGDLSWTPDSQRIAVPTRDTKESPLRIALVEIDSREVTYLTEPKAGLMGDTTPAFSPDGSSVLFVRRSGVSSGWNIFRLALSDEFEPAGAPEQITHFERRAASPAWMPDGRSLLFVGEQGPGQSGIWLTTLFETDEPRLLWRSTGMLSSGEDSRLAIATGTDGRIQIAFGFMTLARQNIYRIDLTGPNKGKLVPLVATSTRDTHGRTSPDGQRLAFFSGDPMRDLWIADADGGNQRRLAELQSRTIGQISWSPDGRAVALHARPKAAADLYVVEVESGKVRQLTDHPSDDAMASWSRDGKWIYFGSNRTGDFTIWKIPASGGEEELVLDVQPRIFEESWDGGSLYYNVPRSGDLFALPLGAEGARPTLLKAGANSSLMGFRVGPSGIFYKCGRLDAPFTEPLPLCLFDPETKTVTQVLDSVQGYLSSVAPDESHVLMVHGPPRETDLHMLELRE